MSNLALKIVPYPPENVKTKVCSRKDCEFNGVAQPLENFYTDKACKGWFSTQCKSCFIKRSKDRYQRTFVGRKYDLSPTPFGTKRCSSRTCKYLDIPQKLEMFYKDSTKKQGVSSQCRECVDLYQKIKYASSPAERASKLLNALEWAAANRMSRKDIQKKYDDKERIYKLEAIKNQKCFCPGCGVDFSQCNDEGLLIIFEWSHVHNKKCKLRSDEEAFWSCKRCNAGRQGSRCGYWLSPENFHPLCKK